ncbi:MAG TPA: LysR family transcriptional regulator [Blastocatellia bacterium]|nr:LysR family transcriptional regulator [Blastocatellia bacterium]
MHIESLKVFCDLIDTRSFSKAAAKNFISQSAVSQQIRALEDRFNKKLVERSRGGTMSPTTAGMTFYQGCREIMDRFNSLTEEMKGLGNIVSGQVRVGTIYSVGIHELSPVLKRFIKSYPHVNVHIEYSRPNKVYDDVINHVIDIGIVAYPTPKPQIEVIPFGNDRLVLVCSPEHELAGKKRIDITALDGQRFIGFERDIPTRKAVDKILRDRGIAVQYVMELDNIETVKQSVEADLGLTIVPRATVQNEVRAGTLRAVNFTENFARPIGIIHRKGKIFSAATRKFIEMLTEGQEPARD